MTTPPKNEVTQLLLQWSDHNKAALDKLLPLVYRELRRSAGYHMRHERPGHSLQASALVNEAYLRLVEYRSMQCQNRAHFFAVAAQAMRRVLVEHARSRQSEKRGGAAQRISLDDVAVLPDHRAVELVALDDALSSLEVLDPRKCRIVELRYIAGVGIEDTADLLGISTATVERDWRSAKAWLYHAVSEKDSFK